MFPLSILTESILFSLVPKILIYLVGNIRQIKWNRAALIYNNIWFDWDCFHFNLYVVFNHWLDTHLKPVNIYVNYDEQLILLFPTKTILFSIKYAVKCTRCQLWKRIDKWQKWRLTKILRRVSLQKFKS